MNVLQVSAECYPAVKKGGLGDVVGSLPKYLNKLGINTSVVVPKYDLPWFQDHEFEDIYESSANMGPERFYFKIERAKADPLTFPFYAVDIQGRFDRPGVYIDPITGFPYWDEFERFLSFQIAVLEWVLHNDAKPDVIHCHDHHTGMIPFMMTKSFRYGDLESIPTVITVHNAEYQGTHSARKAHLLPEFDWNDYGMLDWNSQFNCLASAIKTAWRVTTVSPSYMEELKFSSSGLEELFRKESGKSQGILNGIDSSVWDPSTDSFIAKNYKVDSVEEGKRENKKVLCESFGLNPELPTFAFIGRLAREKGADLLPDLISDFIHEKEEVNFVVLGSGDSELERLFTNMKDRHTGFFNTHLGYNEKLSHQIYAGADCMVMPSRVEPCGLNQMYAMKYGTMPVVRAVGGLKDTVIDVDKGGTGIQFKDFNLLDSMHALRRALERYRDPKTFNETRKRMMRLNFSWKNSAKEYRKLYQQLTKTKGQM
ncbi:MAG TPA: glycogen synthase [Balneolales bacterium]|nr:glycogen synthase [Balneolales bacterium]